MGSRAPILWLGRLTSIRIVQLIVRCQGTPVVMPYFAKDKQDDSMDLQLEKGGWDMYSDLYVPFPPARPLSTTESS